MIRISAANTLEDLKALAQSGATEVLLGAAELSRYGSIDSKQIVALACEAKKLGLRTVLEWDILMAQPEFDKACVTLKSIPADVFDAIRVQDPGALEYVLDQRPHEAIQLILETGNHNLEGVLRWCEYARPRLERVVLSSQLPLTILEEWIKKLPVPAEVLGLGAVLILYTPRHLLSNQLPETAAAEHMRATASSEESFHSGFRVIENRHGTFVFLGQDYCLMDRIEELTAAGVGAVRLDMRLSESPELLAQIAGLISVTKNLDAADLLENYPHPTTRCFFKANNTDKAFVRLKNESLIRCDNGYIGEVVESAKDSHLIIHVRAQGQKLYSGQKLRVMNPQGEEQILAVGSLQTLESEDAGEILTGDYGVIPYSRFCPAKSAVYTA